MRLTEPGENHGLRTWRYFTCSRPTAFWGINLTFVAGSCSALVTRFVNTSGRCNASLTSS